MSALRRRLRTEQSGFTLVELMVAISIGMVIVLAAYNILDASVRAWGNAEARAEVSQKGRLGMDIIARNLRSQACPTTSSSSTTPIGSFVVAEANRAVFWVDLGRAADTTVGRTKDPSLSGISYSSGVINEQTFASNLITSTAVNRSIVRDVVPNNGSSTVLFKYYEFNDNYDPAVTDTSNAGYGLYKELATPVAAAKLPEIVQVSAAFRSYKRNGAATDKITAAFSDQVTLRSADISRRSIPACQ